jgi:polymorphic toxin system DSP-PTPase phosphatase-like protein
VKLPIRSSYWAADGLLAGEYPGSLDAVAAERRLRAFAVHDVTVFVDLTHPADGLDPYDRLLGATGRRIPHPIVDMGTTTIPHMSRILDDVDAALANGRTVYVHCRGGVGRTGTVIGCWLMRHGLDEGDPIRRIAKLRRDLEAAWMSSPETAAQRAMVAEWKRGR